MIGIVACLSIALIILALFNFNLIQNRSSALNIQCILIVEHNVVNGRMSCIFNAYVLKVLSF